MAAKNGSKHNGRAARGTVVRAESRLRRKVRVAIVGVGNCASSLVQGVEYYRDAKPGASIPGLMHVDLGSYNIRDIEFAAAFDIDKDKVGKDLADAIFSGHNNTVKFADVPELGIKVERGMTHDGLGKYLKQKIKKAPGETPTSSASSRRPRPTSSSATSRSAPSRPPSGTSSRPSRPVSASSTAYLCSSPARTTGTSASRKRA